MICVYFWCVPHKYMLRTISAQPKHLLDVVNIVIHMTWTFVSYSIRALQCALCNGFRAHKILFFKNRNQIQSNEREGKSTHIKFNSLSHMRR